MTARFVFACTLQVAIIAGVALSSLAVITGGTEIMLRIEPVDPRDPLRGDYLAFQYAISTLDGRLFPRRPAQPGEEVYVALAPRGGYWEATRVDFTPPRDAAVFIRGRVLSPMGSGPPTRVRVAYGIEQYFVPEGRGVTFDARTRNVAAQVAVDRRGQAVLKRLYVDGRPWP